MVIGPPGSGKTTYCSGMSQYLTAIGRRNLVINLDPANDANDLPYPVGFDVMRELVRLDRVAEEHGLGPNGGLMVAMEVMADEVEYIEEKIRENVKNYDFSNTVGAPPSHDDSQKSDPSNGDVYLIFDFPGQVELFTHDTCVSRIVRHFQSLDYRLACVQLVDSHFCSNAGKFLSAVLVATTAMIRMEMPMVNVLSKIDLLTRYGELPFNLDFFAECNDLERMVQFLDCPFGQVDERDGREGWDFTEDEGYMEAKRRVKDSPFNRKYRKLNEQVRFFVLF